MFFPYYDWKADKIRCSKYWRRRVYYARRKWVKHVAKMRVPLREFKRGGGIKVNGTTITFDTETVYV